MENILFSENKNIPEIPEIPQNNTFTLIYTNILFIFLLFITMNEYTLNIVINLILLSINLIEYYNNNLINNKNNENLIIMCLIIIYVMITFDESLFKYFINGTIVCIINLL